MKYSLRTTLYYLDAVKWISSRFQSRRFGKSNVLNLIIHDRPLWKHGQQLYINRAFFIIFIPMSPTQGSSRKGGKEGGPIPSLRRGLSFQWVPPRQGLGRVEKKADQYPHYEEVHHSIESRQAGSEKGGKEGKPISLLRGDHNRREPWIGHWSY